MLRNIPYHLLSLLIVAVGAGLSPTSAGAEETESQTTHYLRGAYQYGWVLQTNEFVEGDNLQGEPIDNFHSARLEFGWQTDGSSDWHHLYNFPSFGIGIYSADYFNEEELGKPTSLYGFFCWPAKRWSPRWQWTVDVAFGLTDNWVAYDPESNPKNIAIGAASSVHIDVGTNIEYRLARHWSLLGGFSFTHFSNGGSAKPNAGINQIAPLIFVKYKFQEPAWPDRRHDIPPFDPNWKLGITGSVGKRNINHNTADLPNPEDTVYKDYFIGTFLATVTHRVSHVTCWTAGLDFTFDESVEDLVWLEDLRNGTQTTVSAWDKWSLGPVVGYERVVNRAHVLLQLGYTLFRKDVEGQVPPFYQRLGLSYFIFDGFSAGLNVRLTDFSRANNLEFNVGYWFGL
jgi:hypothetical protein